MKIFLLLVGVCGRTETSHPPFPSLDLRPYCRDHHKHGPSQSHPTRDRASRPRGLSPVPRVEPDCRATTHRRPSLLPAPRSALSWPTVHWAGYPLLLVPRPPYSEEGPETGRYSGRGCTPTYGCSARGDRRAGGTDLSGA